MKVLAASTLALILLTGTAFSQQTQMPRENANDLANKQDAAISRAIQAHKNQVELDAAYKATMDRKKARPAPTDPWANVRSSGH